MSASCPVPGRWVLDELAREVALQAADRELAAALQELYHLEFCAAGEAEALDRYITALEARNVLRDGAR